MLYHKPEVQLFPYNQAHPKRIHFRVPQTQWIDVVPLIDFPFVSTWVPSPKVFNMRGDP